ncbi:hypothetical protein [Parafrankia sp. CH37]|uniref:hypothetical protein n=1 Tax=Parafrankia sp. CH37 TaxID=683308 RepID=UPI001868D476|nr:hypothetical protein [Parafrankia sp. CH37]MBE3202281.1 hypothetical protein [Parafrankia sp. CH37]
MPFDHPFDQTGDSDYLQWYLINPPLSQVLVAVHSDGQGPYAIDLAGPLLDDRDTPRAPERVPGVFQVIVQGGLDSVTVQLDGLADPVRIPPAALATVIRRYLPPAPTPAATAPAIALVTPRAITRTLLHPAAIPVMLTADLNLPVLVQETENSPIAQWFRTDPAKHPAPVSVLHWSFTDNENGSTAINLAGPTSPSALTHAPAHIIAAANAGARVVIVGSSSDGRMSVHLGSAHRSFQPHALAHLVTAVNNHINDSGDPSRKIAPKAGTTNIEDASEHIAFWVLNPGDTYQGSLPDPGYNERITRFEREVREQIGLIELTAQPALPEVTYPGAGSVITLNDGTEARTVHLGGTITNEVDGLLAALIASAAAQHPDTHFPQILDNLAIAPSHHLTGLRNHLADLHDNHLATLTGQTEQSSQTSTDIPRLLADLLGIRITIHTPTASRTITGRLDFQPTPTPESPTNPANGLPTVAIFEDPSPRPGDVRYHALQPTGTNTPLPTLRDNTPPSYDDTLESAALTNTLRHLQNHLHQRFPDIIPAPHIPAAGIPAIHTQPPAQNAPQTTIPGTTTPLPEDPDAITQAPAGEPTPEEPSPRFPRQPEKT